MCVSLSLVLRVSLGLVVCMYLQSSLLISTCHVMLFCDAFVGHIDVNYFNGILESTVVLVVLV